MRNLFALLVLAGVLVGSTCSGGATCKMNPDGSVECSITAEGHKHGK